MMRKEHHATSGIMKRNRVQDRPQPENHVAPALTARWPMVEFAEKLPEPGLIGKDVVYACKGKAIEYTEFLLPQALVKADGFVCRCADIIAEDLRCLECAQIGRGEQDFRALLLAMCCEPKSEERSVGTECVIMYRYRWRM